MRQNSKVARRNLLHWRGIHQIAREPPAHALLTNDWTKDSE